MKILRLLYLVSLGVGGAWLLRTYLYETVSIASESMEPTLYMNVHYIVNRWVYRFEAPKRGDIISLVSPVDHETAYIKRVIAIPGDEIELREKRVYLNGQLQEEAYVIYKLAKQRLDGDNLGPMTVPDKHVFVLGDNRDLSLDSTSWVDLRTKKPIYFLPFSSIRGRLRDPAH